jgi:7-dehydrocholesterol reductase
VDLPPILAGAVVALGLAGYAIFLSANRQRDRFRRAPDGRCRIGHRAATFVAARYVSGDGRSHEGRLLASGWWALSRHPNYLGAVYLPVLLVHRARRDETRCRAKYGAAWDTYRAAVPARILPGVW